MLTEDADDALLVGTEERVPRPVQDVRLKRRERQCRLVRWQK